MTTIKLKYVHSFIDRHGKRRRYYFRRAGQRQVTLAGVPGSEEFMAAYHAAMSGGKLRKREIGAERAKPGSMSELIAMRISSVEFKNMKPSSQVVQRRILSRLDEEHGEKPVRSLQRRHVYDMVRAKAETPAAANHLLTELRTLMQLAVDNDMRNDNPTREVKRIRYKTKPFYSWKEEDIKKFEGCWTVGTRQRLAFDLYLYTAQRGSDVARMGPQHVSDGVLSIEQEKTGNRVDIPLHPNLARSIYACPSGHLAFVVTEFGKPFSVKGFQQWFVDAVHKAGLPQGVSGHGLRKAASRRLAELDCTEDQIMAITGHESSDEARKYLKDANRKKLARSAMDRLIRSTEQTE